MMKSTAARGKQAVGTSTAGNLQTAQITVQPNSPHREHNIMTASSSRAV